MKILLLRHEKRGIDLSFFSELTKNGLLDAENKVKNELLNHNIDYIFSSPFTRTLQTIYPYCTNVNKKVNIEYGLYEYMHNPIFLIGNWLYYTNDLKYDNLKNIINKKYKSKVKENSIVVLENEETLSNRITIFFNYLKKNKKYKNKTILIVSHMAIINKIKDLYLKKTSLNDLFEMGNIEILEI